MPHTNPYNISVTRYYSHSWAWDTCDSMLKTTYKTSSLTLEGEGLLLIHIHIGGVHWGFSLICPASMPTYWKTGKHSKRKEVNFQQIFFEHNMATASLFWNTSMAAVMSCQNTQ